jgi:hypothetical protein
MSGDIKNRRKDKKRRKGNKFVIFFFQNKFDYLTIRII